MLGAALMTSWYVAAYAARFSGITVERLFQAFLVTIGSGLVGARLLFVVLHWQNLDGWRAWLSVGRGGLVSYGGFLGGALGAFIFFRKHRVPVLKWTDIAAPSVASGIAVGRIGCYLYGCDFGMLLSSAAPAWLKHLGTFPRWDNLQGSPAFLRHVRQYHLQNTAPSALPVHPTQLYESLFGFACLALLLWLATRRPARGVATAVILIGYSSFRFMIEWVRDDPQRGFLLGLSTGQWISLALLPIGLLLLLSRMRAAYEPSEIEGPRPSPV